MKKSYATPYHCQLSPFLKVINNFCDLLYLDTVNKVLICKYHFSCIGNNNNHHAKDLTTNYIDFASVNVVLAKN